MSVTQNLETQIELISKKFIEKTKGKEIQIISHFDTDGITAAAIIIQTLKKLDRKFSIKIIKSLEEQFIYDLQDKPTLFLDLASASLKHIENSKLTNVFIIDHHEINQNIPEKVSIINPQINDVINTNQSTVSISEHSEVLNNKKQRLQNKQKISTSGLAYLFCRHLHKDTKQFAKLAVIGMIGDCMEKEIDKLNHSILKDGEIIKKRGLLIYPSTRPINRTLEFSSNPYIPQVTGNIKGVMELLREAGINPESGKYKNLIDFNSSEMEKLTTAIILRKPKAKDKNLIGDLFLIKIHGKLEDARELSAMINACSRYGQTGAALQMCMEIPQAKKRAESIHIKYKQELIAGLRFAENTQKIQGKGFVIINAKDQIKDTMIGTIASILSYSSTYQDGTIIIGMARYDDKTKISARNCGNIGRSARELLNQIIEIVGGQTGGHEFAAGAIIARGNESEFVAQVHKQMEIPLIKI